MGLTHTILNDMAKKTLNVGMVGYGFMGRAHSNAFRQAPKFFDLPYEPVLKAVSARNLDRVSRFAENWGYLSTESDWRQMVSRNDIDLIDIAAPNDMQIVFVPLNDARDALVRDAGGMCAPVPQTAV